MRVYTIVLLVVGVCILAPFALLGARVEQVAVSVLSDERSGAIRSAAIVVLLLAADTVLPIPSSLVSMSGGALMGIAGGTAASTIGMSVGCVFGYCLGRRARGAVDRRTSTAERERVEEMFAQYGDWAVLFGRAVPVLAESTTVFAGLSRMPLTRFVLLTSCGNLSLSIVYASVGARAVVGKESFLAAFATAQVIPLAFLLLLRVHERRRRRRRDSDGSPHG